MEEVIVIERLVIRPVVWSAHRLGGHTILSLSLLCMALGSLAFGLTQLVRGVGAHLLLPLVVCGVLLGWILAKSPLSGWLAGIVALIFGVELGIIQTGQMSKPLINLVRSLVEETWNGLNWPVTEPPSPSLIKVAVADVVWSASSIIDRARAWLLALTSGQVAFDPMPTALLWGLILWLAAVWAGWAVRRHHRPLRAVAPAGVLLAVALSYTWNDPILLWIFLATTLLLMLLTGQIARERRWEAAGMDFSPELRFELAATTLPVWAILILAALLAPSISVRPVAESAQQLIVQHLRAGRQVADAMGLEPRAGPGIALNRVHAAGMPNRRLIGSGPELSEEIVMLVYPYEQSETQSLSSKSKTATHTYWRALTFDEYTGRGWLTSEIAEEAYSAGKNIPPAQQGGDNRMAGARRTLRHAVTGVGDLGGLLYTTGELIAADQDYVVAWRSHHDLFGAEIGALSYRTDSWIPITSDAQLRSAGQAYPDWIEERYLALPSEVPTRVLALAQQLTSDYPTSYDQARAIETYLRAFTYTLDLPAPPPNQEITDYFLFDLKQGYCDYYATSMVVLARAAGLPARLVVGYASGAYHSTNARYVVSQADAHSWVEIYFPDIGWVEFEPTGGRPPIVHPAEAVAADLTQTLPPLDPINNRRAVPRMLGLLGTLTGLIVLGFAILGWWWADSWRLRRIPPGAVADALYQRLCRYGRLLAVPVETGDTPYEFAERLQERITDLAGKRRLGDTSTSTNQDVHWLIDLYVQRLYSRHKPSTAHQSQAMETWQRLRQRMWLAWVWQKTRRQQVSEDYKQKKRT